MEQGTHGMERSTMEQNILHVYGTIIFDYLYSLDREMPEIHGCYLSIQHILGGTH